MGTGVSAGVIESATSLTLLHRLSGGEDPLAWYDFDRRYSGFLHAVLAARGVHPTDRDDIVQDVLTSLVRSMPRFRYDRERGRFRAYLKTVVLRAMAQRRRSLPISLGAQDVASTALGDEAFEAIWDAQWRRHHAQTALATLRSRISDLDRAVFDDYAIRSQSATTVAHEHGVSVERVYRIKSDLLAQLSQIIERQVDEEG